MADVIALLPNTPCAFTFKIEHFAFADIASLSDVSELISAISDNGTNIIPDSIEPEILNDDLILIDSCLPQLLAYLFIQFVNSGVGTFKELMVWLEKDNPLKFNQYLGHRFYEYKLIMFAVSLIETAGVILKIDYKSIPAYLIENTKLLFEDIQIGAVDVKSNTLAIKSTIRIELHV